MAARARCLDQGHVDGWSPARVGGFVASAVTQRPRMRSEISHLPPSRASLFSKFAPLDSEIAADLLVVEHMRLLGRLAHLFDRDRIEIAKKGFARPAHGRINGPLDQH
jgi:hypothetical protein